MRHVLQVERSTMHGDEPPLVLSWPSPSPPPFARVSLAACFRVLHLQHDARSSGSQALKSLWI